MKKFILTIVFFIFTCIANAQSSGKTSDFPSNENEIKISKKIKLDDVIFSKQAIVNKHKAKKFEKNVTIDSNFDYSYVVFYTNSKLNSIVKLNPVGNLKSSNQLNLIKIGDFRNLDAFGKKTIALGE